MADSKISALAGAGDLTGAEHIPGVQSAVTKKITPTQLAVYMRSEAATAELIRDTAGAALVAGTGIAITVNDGADTIGVALADAGRVRVLAASAVAASHTGDTAETALATIAIPAGVMGLNGIVRVTHQWTLTNDASAKTARVRLGGIAGTAFYANSLPSFLSSTILTQFRNRGAANSQLGNQLVSGGYSSLTSAHVTGAVNTAVAQDLVISAQLADSADTMTLESYLVELLTP